MKLKKIARILALSSTLALSVPTQQAQAFFAGTSGGATTPAMLAFGWIPTPLLKRIKFLEAERPYGSLLGVSLWSALTATTLNEENNDEIKLTYLAEIPSGSNISTEDMQFYNDTLDKLIPLYETFLFESKEQGDHEEDESMIAALNRFSEALNKSDINLTRFHEISRKVNSENTALITTIQDLIEASAPEKHPA